MSWKIAGQVVTLSGTSRERSSYAISGTIYDQVDVDALGDVARYLIQMQLHGFDVGVQQRERRADSARRADRAEQTCVLIVGLIGG
jgi:hypothetical protein